MHPSQQRLSLLKKEINEICKKKQLKTIPQIIAVTKTFSFDEILPLLQSNHNHFGENKIQEAENKWSQTRNEYPKLQLHMLGKLQTNKAKKAVKLFDYIHSLDSFKLAEKIYKYEKELNKKLKLFIQVNLGEESQKSGINLENLGNFYNYCAKDLSLNILGLMCLPPINVNPDHFFKNLKTASDNLRLKHLSMGMSADYENAISNGSTFLRLGTAIFGERKTN